jgi:uncharacterized membrane protein
MSAYLYKITGIILALLAMSLFNLAPVLQKSALDRLPPLLFSNLWKSIISLLKDRRWMLGFLIGCLGLLPYVAAMSLVGVAVVQPLYGFGFIVLIIVSRFMLHEKLHPAAKLAMGLLILMPVLIALGDVSGVQYDITRRSTQISLGVFVTVTLLASVVLTFFTKKHPLYWAVISAALFGAGAVFAQLAITFLTVDELRNLNSFTALICNRNILFCVAAMLAATTVNVLAGYFVQVGLQQKMASQFMPITQTVSNAMAITGGVTIFGQCVTHWSFYIAGIVMGLAGLFLLARFTHEPELDFKSGE